MSNQIIFTQREQLQSTIEYLKKFIVDSREASKSFGENIHQLKKIRGLLSRGGFSSKLATDKLKEQRGRYIATEVARKKARVDLKNAFTLVKFFDEGIKLRVV